MNYKPYFIQIETRDGRLIYSGKANGSKLACGYLILYDKKLVSIDGKRFFHMCGNANYIVTEMDSIDKTYIDEEYINTLKSEKWSKYAKYENPLDIDYFIDNDITGIDKPIQDLIYALNSIDGIYTTSSCCGHNVEPAYIQIAFNNFDGITKFLYLLQDINLKLYKYWYINLRKYLVVNLADVDIHEKFREVQIDLLAYEIGYKPIEILNSAVNVYINNNFFKKKELN